MVLVLVATFKEPMHDAVHVLGYGMKVLPQDVRLAFQSFRPRLNKGQPWKCDLYDDLIT